MGFKSVLGKIGKVGLKVAPYAALAIPGVGPLAMAGIQAGIGAAQSKASGGSWKDALKSGAVSAGTSYAGSKIPGLDKIGGDKLGKGLAPSAEASFVRGQVNEVNKRVAGGGIKSALGNLAKETGKNYLKDTAGKSSSNYVDALAQLMRKGGNNANDGATNARVAGNQSNTDAMPRSRGWATNANYEGNMRGLGPVMGRRDQNFPNLAESIGAGRQDAIRNQPFRGGYDMLTNGPEPADDAQGNVGPVISTRSPKIYPTGRRRMN